MNQQLTLNYENIEEPKGKAIGHQKVLEQFEKFNRVGLWAKKFADLLIGMEGWYSMKCSLTWKLRATKSHRFYFQLVPLTLPIEEIGFGLLPTPTCIDQSNATATMKSTQVKEGSMHSVTLTRAMVMGMLPTPIAGDWKGQLRSDGTANMLSGKMALLHKSGMLPTPDASIRGARKNQNGHQVTLQDIAAGYTIESQKIRIKAGMLPTPTSSIVKHGHSEKYWDNRIGKRQMDIAMWNAENNGKTSQLNPQFVLEMMGFPTDWTLLPFLNGETNQSKQ